MEVLHGGLHDAAFARNWFITEVIEIETCFMVFIHPCDIINHEVLEPVKHVQIGVLENIKARVTVHWGEPACINTEEKAELLGKIALFDIGARFGRYPELLWICR